MSLPAEPAIISGASAANRTSRFDFEQQQASRPDYPNVAFQYTKTPDPKWKPGAGANHHFKQGTSVTIDPNGVGRKPGENYKLLCSGITPRPIALLSTRSNEGVENLAPFSYFQVVGYDPPLFVIGFESPTSKPKDSLRNLLETGEATINLVSDAFIEAMNYTSIDAPPTVSEWDLCGLTKADSQRVKAKRVKESAFSIEVMLESVKDLKNKRGEPTGTVVFLEGILFHAWEEALNEDGTLLLPAVLRSVARLGRLGYSVVEGGLELRRPVFGEEMEGEAAELLKTVGTA